MYAAILESEEGAQPIYTQFTLIALPLHTMYTPFAFPMHTYSKKIWGTIAETEYACYIHSL